MAFIGNLQSALTLNTRDWSGNWRKAERDLNSSSARINKGLGKIQLRFNRLTRNSSRHLTRLNSALLGLGVGFSLQKVVREFNAFDRSMRQIVGLVGVAEKEVAGFRKAIDRLAPQVGKGPKELADALFFVTSAGLRGAKAMDVLEKSARAAVAGLGETKQVADAVTSAMNAYQSANLTAAQATDTLVATVREGKLEATELSSAIGRILPIAEAAGVRFDEVGASIAALTRIGLSAPEAITGVRQTLIALQKETTEGAEELERLGTSFAELRQTIRERGLLAALQDLKNRVGDSDTALQTILGRAEAANAVLALTGSQADEVAGIFDRMSRSTGALDAAFKAVADSGGQRLASVTAELEVAMKNLGRSLTPLVTFMAEEAVNAANFWADAISNLNEEFTRLQANSGLFRELFGSPFQSDLEATNFRIAETKMQIGELNEEMAQLLRTRGSNTGGRASQITSRINQIKAEIAGLRAVLDDLESVRSQLEGPRGASKPGPPTRGATGATGGAATSRTPLTVQADQVETLTRKITQQAKARRELTNLISQEITKLNRENMLTRLVIEGRDKEALAIRQTMEALDILQQLKEAGAPIDAKTLANIRAEIVERDKLAERLEDQAEIKALLDRHAERQKRAAETQATETVRIWTQASDDIVSGFNDAIFQMFRGSKNRDLVGDFLDFVQDGFARLFANLATMALIRPIVVPIVGSIAGGLGFAGAGGLVDSSFGFGGLGSFGPSLAGAAFPGGDFSLFGAGGLLDLQGILSTPLTGSVVGPLGPTLPGITLGGALGAGALGAAGGALLGPLLGLNQVGAGIGGGLGAAGGAILGSIVPGVGTVLGGILGGAGGGILGGLFGGGRSVGPLARANLSFQGGRLSLGTFAADNDGDVQRAVAVAQQAIQQVNSLIDSLGLTLKKASSVSAFIGGERATASIRSQGIRTGATVEDLLDILISPQFLSSANPEINRLIRSQNIQGLQAVPAIRSSVLGQTLAAGQSIQQFLNAQQFSASSSLSPTGRFTEAQRQFQDLLSRVRGGDVGLTGNLTQTAGLLLDIGRTNFGTATPDFANLESFVRSSLASVGQQITDPGAIQERIVQAIRQQTAVERTSSDAQVEAIEALRRDIQALTHELREVS